MRELQALISSPTSSPGIASDDRIADPSSGMLISPPIDHSSADLAAVRAPARARVVQAILQTDGFTFVEEDRDPNIIASLNLLDLTAAVHEHMHAAAARNFW